MQQRRKINTKRSNIRGDCCSSPPAPPPPLSKMRSISRRTPPTFPLRPRKEAFPLLRSLSPVLVTDTVPVRASPKKEHTSWEGEKEVVEGQRHLQVRLPGGRGSSKLCEKRLSCRCVEEREILAKLSFWPFLEILRLLAVTFFPVWAQLTRFMASHTSNIATSCLGYVASPR